jgi:Flp pilus assembly CpaF family ATPase
MADVELVPTLRALLGPLEVYLGDEDVMEILVAGPDRVLVTREGVPEMEPIELSEKRIRSLADRLLRDIARNGAKNGLVRGRLAGFDVSVVGTPASGNCPVIRMARGRRSAKSLTDLAAEGRFETGVDVVVKDAMSEGAAIVICGRHATGKTDLFLAVAKECQSFRRVVALDEKGGVLERAGIGQVHLDPDGGVRGALAIGADLIAIEEPTPHQLHELLVSGRPFVTTVEAQDAPNALSRLTALLLAADPLISRAAAEALLESSVNLLIETIREGERAVARSVLELFRDHAHHGELSVRPSLSRKRKSGAPSLTRELDAAIGSLSPLGQSPIPQSAARPAPRTPRRSPSTNVLLTPPISNVSDRRRPSSASMAALMPDALVSPAAIDDEVEPPPAIESSGMHMFGSAEVSEIRADQLVSKSFVMNLGDLGIESPSDSGDVVLIDHDEKSDDDSSQDIPIPEAVRDEVSSAHALLPAARPLDQRLGAVAGNPSQDLISPIASADIEPFIDTLDSDSERAPLLASRIVEEISALETRKPKRELSERTPTVLSHPPKDAPPLITSPPDWSEAVPGDESGAHDIDGELVTASGLGVDPSSPGTDTHALPETDLGGVRRAPLSLNDLDSTQAAKLGEMASPYDQLKESGTDSDMNALSPPGDPAGAQRITSAEIDPDPTPGQLGPPKPPRKPGGFDEKTPYAPMLKANGVQINPVQGSIDANRAAVVSGEEFDAILEEIRDVTNASTFDVDEEATTGEDGKPLKGRRVFGTDPKKRMRPR